MQRLLTSIAAAVLFTGIAPAVQAETPKRGTFVLVHGAFFDGSGFARTAEALEQRGYAAVTVNLPGRPANPADPRNVTLAGHRDAVLAAVHGVQGPVWLVGHSFGGIVVSEAAEAAPDRIAGVIYLAALLPQTGEALTDLLPQDTGTTMGPNSFQPDPVAGVANIAREDRVRLFCAECSSRTRARLPDRLVDEPLPPLAQKTTLTARFASVPKAYVYTRQDAILSYAFQQVMVQRTPVRETATLETGHAPFLSDPSALAAALIAVTD